MNLLLFIFVLFASFVVVRIGAVAFQLTGLEWSLAKFQSLSCFTGTGFTTRESELVTNNAQRRRIASILMVLGNAGLVTMIATFVNSIRPADYFKSFSIPFLRLVIPSVFLPWINLAILVVSFYLIYKIFSSPWFAKKITEALRIRLIERDIIRPVTFEELMVLTGGYGVSNAEICGNSPVLDKAISETGLRRHDISILVLERKGHAIPNPPAETRIELGDRLICFGKLEDIRLNLLAVI